MSNGWQPPKRDAPEPDARVVDLRCMLVKLDGQNWVGFVTVGGVPIRGRVAADPLRALQYLLWELTESSGNDNARIALTFALQTTTLDSQLARLVDSGLLPPEALNVLPEDPQSKGARQADAWRAHAIERGQAGDPER